MLAWKAQIALPSLALVQFELATARQLDADPRRASLACARVGMYAFAFGALLGPTPTSLFIAHARVPELRAASDELGIRVSSADVVPTGEIDRRRLLFAAIEIGLKREGYTRVSETGRFVYGLHQVLASSDESIARRFKVDSIVIDVIIVDDTIVIDARSIECGFVRRLSTASESANVAVLPSMRIANVESGVHTATASEWTFLQLYWLAKYGLKLAADDGSNQICKVVFEGGGHGYDYPLSALLSASGFVADATRTRTDSAQASERLFRAFVAIGERSGCFAFGRVGVNFALNRQPKWFAAQALPSDPLAPATSESAEPENAAN